MRSQKSVSENNHWKNKTPHPVPLRWRGAAQRRGGQRMQEYAATLFFFVILGLAPVVQPRGDKENSEYQKPAYDNFFLARYVANK